MIADEVHKIRKSDSQISQAIFDFKKKDFGVLQAHQLKTMLKIY